MGFPPHMAGISLLFSVIFSWLSIDLSLRLSSEYGILASNQRQSVMLTKLIKNFGGLLFFMLARKSPRIYVYGWFGLFLGKAAERCDVTLITK